MNKIELVANLIKDSKSYSQYSSLIKKNFPEIHDQLCNGPYKRYAENLYLFLNNLETRPYCKSCKKNELSYIDRATGYGLYCSHSCYVQDGCSVDKRRDTNIERYGFMNVLSNKEVRSKRDSTMLERYGSIHALQNKELKDKSVASFKKNDMEEISAKRKSTIMDRYGVSNIWDLKDFRQKIKDSNLKKYGTEWVQQNKEILEKRKQSKNKKFYDNLHHRVPGYKPLFDSNQYNGVGFKYPWECLTCHSYFEDTIDDGFDPICPTCFPRGHGISTGEAELLFFIKNELNISNIVTNTRDIIPPKEIDIWLPDYKIAIEYNGLYWHSDKKITNRYYHQQKFLKCEELGVHLIQIFEDEWISKKSIVKNRLSHLLRLSPRITTARQTVIKLVSKSEYNDFMNAYHIQGTCVSSIRVGAYFNNQLVACMSFGNRSIHKNYGWELLRFATIGNIPGIAGKLFSYFINTHNPDLVFSFCDLRWGLGKVYTAIGMKEVSISSPGYWYSKDGIKRLHRYNFRKQKLIELGYDKNLSEKEITESLGYYKIWDAGHRKFIWNKS